VRAVSDDVRAFFDGLPSRIDPSRVAGMRNSYVFDIDGAGTWTVRVEDGAVTVADGTQEADCTISASEDTFRQIVNGDQNPTTAYMTGKLKVKGDIGAAMKLQKLF
jgi:putative sterol carrier protein